MNHEDIKQKVQRFLPPMMPREEMFLIDSIWQLYHLAKAEGYREHITQLEHEDTKFDMKVLRDHMNNVKSANVRASWQKMLNVFYKFMSDSQNKSDPDFENKVRRLVDLILNNSPLSESIQKEMESLALEIGHFPQVLNARVLPLKPWHWCECEEVDIVARDMHATCGQCGGRDAYKTDPKRHGSIKVFVDDVQIGTVTEWKPSDPVQKLEEKAIDIVSIPREQISNVDILPGVSVKFTSWDGPAEQKKDAKK